MLCDRQLRRWYAGFNRKYFADELPDDVDVLWAPTEDCYAMVDGGADGWTLLMNPKYAIEERIAKLTLLHEMVHIHIGKRSGHGPRFQEEMLRLASLGAFNGLW